MSGQTSAVLSVLGRWEIYIYNELAEHRATCGQSVWALLRSIREMKGVDCAEGLLNTVSGLDVWRLARILMGCAVRVGS